MRRWLAASASTIACMTALASTGSYAQTALPAAAADAAPVAVQEGTGQDAVPGDADADAGQDIVVTAQRRSESISRVPLSIQAFSGETLAAAGVIDPSGLAQVTAGLNFARSSANTPIYTLRGVGFNTPNLSSTSPVGIYVDEVSLAYPYMSNGPLFDVERVEVLKGPQGTLYGRNTTGGLINFITAKPGDRLEGGISAELGNYQTYNFEGFISTPLGDAAGLRLSGRWENSDLGWQRSVSRGDRLGEKDRLGARAILTIDPAADLSIQLSASYWRDRSDTVASQAIAVNPDSPAFVLPGLAAAARTNWGLGEADWDPPSAGKPGFRVDSRFYSLAARVGYDLSDTLSIVSLTGYNDIRRDDFNDVDGTRFEVFAYRSLGRIKSFSQELRLVGQADRLNYTIGGYYSNDDIVDGQIGYFDASSILRQLRFVAGRVPDPRYTAAQKAGGFRNFRTTTDQNSRSLSVFGNADYALTDQIKVTGGLRYSDDRLRYSACSRDFEGNTVPVWNTAVPFVIAARTGTPFRSGTVGINECLTYRADFQSVAPYEKPTLREDNVAGRLAINYQVTPDDLVYASVSRGFKSGAVPIIAGNVETQFAPATQERVTAYEVGTKLRLAERLVRLNLAGFYMNYRDKQLFGEIPDPVFTTLTRIVNIPRSKIWVGEAEVVVTPARGLTMNAGASYTRTEVTSYVGFDRFGAQVDFAGDEFPYTPRWQLNGGATYDASISSDLGLQANVTVSHQSRTSGALGDEAGFEIKPYTLVNASVTLIDSANGFRVGAYARNLFNENYWTAADILTDTTFRVPALPRTYGVTLGYRF